VCVCVCQVCVCVCVDASLCALICGSVCVSCVCMSCVCVSCVMRVHTRTLSVCLTGGLQSYVSICLSSSILNHECLSVSTLYLQSCVCVCLSLTFCAEHVCLCVSLCVSFSMCVKIHETYQVGARHPAATHQPATDCNTTRQFKSATQEQF